MRVRTRLSGGPMGIDFTESARRLKASAAAESFGSTFTRQRRFTMELYGTTVHKFLVRERLRKAKTMVQYTQLPFKTIGKMVGFKSFAHFSWAFKERYGDSPRYYRAKMKREEAT